MYGTPCRSVSDLSQPLLPSITVGKFDYLIEYEQVHQICFSCGRVGHRRDIAIARQQPDWPTETLFRPLQNLAALILRQCDLMAALSDAFPEGMEHHKVALKPTWTRIQCTSRIHKLLGNPIHFPLDNNHLMDCFNILIWNCWGEGNEKFKHNFCDLFRLNKPKVVALLETKVGLSSMGMFFKTLGLTASTHVDPTGRLGGIWVPWDPTKVSVNTTLVTTQAIHVRLGKMDLKNGPFAPFYCVR